MTLRGRLDSLRHRLRRGDTERSAPFTLPDLYSSRNPEASRRVGVLVYQGVTTAEIDAPVKALAAGLDADVLHIGPVGVGTTVVGVEPVRSVHVDMTTDAADALHLDVVVIPGGLVWEQLVADTELMTWLAHVTRDIDGILAISTGSLILASAGRLAGTAATGHWLAQDVLSALGADVRRERTAVSQDSRIVTASGANSATAAASRLAERVRWGPT